MKEWLNAAAGWRAASLLFQAPSRGARQDLGSLAGELPEEFRDRVGELLAIPLDEWETEFHRVLGPGGCPARESSYDDNALAGRGPLLAEIAGFYEAFAYRPEPTNRETPDNLAVELGFLSYMALKVAYAAHEGKSQERQVAEDAYWCFLEAHVGFWLARFGETVTRAGSGIYDASLACLAHFVGKESRRARGF